MKKGILTKFEISRWSSTGYIGMNVELGEGNKGGKTLFFTVDAAATAAGERVEAAKIDIVIKNFV